ncbi:hypothetical protein Pmani_017801 [Petrolisthes manimaculis]|uniref:Uncharacterized protein n=1 Tax=Petrolisthes manimaculis TaxID=1843537 RepID=A0AAE1PNQ1_9EUCA|nr:hypothetical protein Pmani_017801 [Petrolisthes manimaculis]
MSHPQSGEGRPMEERDEGQVTGRQGFTGQQEEATTGFHRARRKRDRVKRARRNEQGYRGQEEDDATGFQRARGRDDRVSEGKMMKRQGFKGEEEEATGFQRGRRRSDDRAGISLGIDAAIIYDLH